MALLHCAVTSRTWTLSRLLSSLLKSIHILHKYRRPSRGNVSVAFLRVGLATSLEAVFVSASWSSCASMPVFPARRALNPHIQLHVKLQHPQKGIITPSLPRIFSCLYISPSSSISLPLPSPYSSQSPSPQNFSSPYPDQTR
jgi:hypothetical protein